ncbi:MAG: GldG family protein [Candidatus Hydrogenedentes bacterium]|nr:GldG family protein [Candidatus Hydrogenedentota bacterium]
MQKLRMITGLAALVPIAVAANLLVWQQAALMPFAWGLLLLGVALGVVWGIQAAVGLAGSAGWEGWAAGGVNAALSTLFFLGICIVLYVFTAGWDASWDLTQEGRRTLAPQTVQVLQSMNEEVEIFCLFLKVDDELVWIAQDKTLRFLERCKKYTGLLKVEVMDPQVEMHRLEAMKVTHVSTLGTIVIRAGGRQRVITLSGGSPRLEERDFTNALINVLRDREQKVGFLTGHKERDIIDDDPKAGASAFANLLVGESYAVERIAIKISDPEVPQDCDILVINRPLADLYPQELKAIDTYLEQGGRLLILLDPWKSLPSEKLRPWLEERFGIVVGSDMVASKNKERLVRLELRNDDGPFADVDEDFMEFSGAYNKGHGITQGFDQVMLLQMVRSVSRADKVPDNVVVTELLRSTPEYWGETDMATLMKEGTAVQQTEEAGGPISLAVAAVRRSEALDETGQPVTSRVVVVGDSDFAANSQLTTAELSGHLNFLLNTIAWLGERQDLIAIRPSGKTDPPLVLSKGEERAIVWISTLLTLQLVVAAGLVVYVLRRKYR